MCEMTEEQLRLVEHYCLTATYENIKADFLSLMVRNFNPNHQVWQAK